MKKIASVFLLFFTFLNVDAQYFFGADYQPKPCYENDSIYILDTVSFNTADRRRSFSTTLQNDTIFLKSCYQFGGFLGGAEVNEKANIGRYPKGSYTVVVKGNYDNGVNCSGDTFINELSFKLEVLAEPNNISNQETSLIQIRSNFIQDKLFLDNMPPKSSLTIFDIQGRNQFKQENVNDSLTIDTETWSIGIYIVSVVVGNEQKRWRLLKD